ncbi:MAG: DUF502 domain-containing protein [Bacteriovoracaceae bacterium]
MKLINKLFFKGLIVVLPVTITIYVLVLVATKAENVFGHFIKGILGSELYVPGLGILLTFAAILGVGILVSNFITGKIINWAIEKFEGFPLIKAIYRPLKDLMSLFSTGGSNNMKKVVFVDFERLGFKTLGLVTREEFSDLPANSVEENKIAVYIPMGYMVGGFTVIVDKENVTELDISVDKAFKLAITGWIKAEKTRDFTV